MGLYTHDLEKEDEIDALLIRLSVMVEQSKPCKVIPFRPVAQAHTSTGHATIIIYKDEVEARQQRAEAYVDSYISTEIKIAKLIDEQEKEISRQAYAKKCDEIERMLDILSAPAGNSIYSRFGHYEFLAGTERETKNFLEEYAAKLNAAHEAEQKALEHTLPTDWI